MTMEEIVGRYRLADGGYVAVPASQSPEGLPKRPPGRAVHARGTRQREVQPSSHEGASRVLGRVGSATRVTVIGCGSVGSHAAIGLARMGVDLLAIDDDVVEASNIEGGRTSYGPRTLGMPKVVALYATIKELSTTARVAPLRRNLADLTDDEIRAIGGDSRAVLASFDDPEGLLRLNAILYPECPVIYPGFHPRGHSGHVIWTQPGVVPCFRCAVGVDSDHPIQTLHGEPAIPVDIQRVADTAVRVVLWTCAPRDSESSRLLDPRRSIIFLDNRPSGSADRMLAARLLEAERDPECPVCTPYLER